MKALAALLFLLLSFFALGGNIEAWIAPETLRQVKGKPREEIFAAFDNTPRPIAAVPLGYATLLDPAVTNATLYCGMAYFLDHAVNHHPELPAAAYTNLQATITHADSVKLDTRAENRRALMFIKGREPPYTIAVVGIGKRKGEKILLHKTFFQTPSPPYPRIPNLSLETP